jgi:parvulin-like peptidyl-prolyl isomerase
MPKAGTSKPATPESDGKRRRPRLLGEYRTRHEREEALQRLIILGTVAVGVIAVLLVAIALIFNQLVVPNQPVATVNGQNISVAQFESRVRLERTLLINRVNAGYNQLLNFGLDQEQAFQQLQQFPPYDSYLSELSVPDQLGDRVLNDMIDDTLIRQQAAERGITVSAEDVDKQIQEFFSYDPNEGLLTPTPTTEPSSTPTPFITPTPTAIPTMTPTPELTPTPSLTPLPSATPTSTPDAATRAADFAERRDTFFTDVRALAQLGEADLRAYFEVRALRQALREQLTTDVTTTGTFVNVRHILVTGQEQAQDVLEALQAGESFVDLAASVSQDQSNAGSGGELGWAPLTQYVDEFSDAARDAEIGAFVGPIQTEFGFHILQVRAREERTLESAELEQAKDRVFAGWLTEVRTQQSGNIQRFDIWVDNIPTDPAFSLGLLNQ